MHLRKWYCYFGKWWMIQYCFNGWLSFGVHIDFLRRYCGKSGEPYGPYIDFHVLCFIISLGYHPVRSTEYPIVGSVGRGGG